MPQEFHVLQCFECKTFQVHQVKKANKWNCKLCGEKQSVIKVFGRGSGADCRHHVQRLNKLRGEQDAVKEQIYINCKEENYYDHDDSNHLAEKECDINQGLDDRSNKWMRYVEESQQHSDSDDDRSDSRYTTDKIQFLAAGKQSGKRKRRDAHNGENSNNFVKKKTRKHLHDEDHTSETSLYNKTQYESWPSDPSYTGQDISTYGNLDMYSQSNSAQISSKYLTDRTRGAKGSKWGQFIGSGEESSLQEDIRQNFSTESNFNSFESDRGTSKWEQFIHGVDGSSSQEEIQERLSASKKSINCRSDKKMSKWEQFIKDEKESEQVIEDEKEWGQYIESEKELFSKIKEGNFEKVPSKNQFDNSANENQTSEWVQFIEDDESCWQDIPEESLRKRQFGNSDTNNKGFKSEHYIGSSVQSSSLKEIQENAFVFQDKYHGVFAEGKFEVTDQELKGFNMKDQHVQKCDNEARYQCNYVCGSAKENRVDRKILDSSRINGNAKLCGDTKHVPRSSINSRIFHTEDITEEDLELSF